MYKRCYFSAVNYKVIQLILVNMLYVRSFNLTIKLFKSYFEIKHALYKERLIDCLLFQELLEVCLIINLISICSTGVEVVNRCLFSFIFIHKCAVMTLSLFIYLVH